MTQYEKITKMSIEEMFNFIKDKDRCEFCYFTNMCGRCWTRGKECENGLRKYLEQEVTY